MRLKQVLCLLLFIFVPYKGHAESRDISVEVYLKKLPAFTLTARFNEKENIANIPYHEIAQYLISNDFSVIFKIGDKSIDQFWIKECDAFKNIICKISFEKEKSDKSWMSKKEFSLFEIQRFKKMSSLYLDSDLNALSPHFQKVKLLGHNTEVEIMLLGVGPEKISCELSLDDGSEKKYHCHSPNNLITYQFVFEKNILGGDIQNLDKKIVIYKPTSILANYTQNDEWKSFGLSKKDYRSLHLYQLSPYKCKSFKTDKNTVCTTSLVNYPQIGSNSINFLKTRSKNLIDLTFKASEVSFESLSINPLTPKINRIPASTK